MRLVAQADVCIAHRLELEAWLILELLHEVTMPAKPRSEAGDTAPPSWIHRVASAGGRVELQQPCARGVLAGTNTYCARTQPRTHPAAGVWCRVWTGHGSAIVHTAIAKEGAQRVARDRLATALHASAQ